jgi:hypothetical protein
MNVRELKSLTILSMKSPEELFIPGVRIMKNEPIETEDRCMKLSEFVKEAALTEEELGVVRASLPKNEAQHAEQTSDMSPLEAVKED